MNIKENIQRAKDRIKELEVLIAAWEATLPQKKFGEKNASWALMLTGFFVAIPVFFDVAFIILIPLLRTSPFP